MLLSVFLASALLLSPIAYAQTEKDFFSFIRDLWENILGRITGFNTYNTTTPSCSLSASPSSGTGSFFSTITVSYSNLSTSPYTIAVSCGNGSTIVVSCTGTTGSCATGCVYPSVTSQTSYTVSASASGTSCSSATVTNNPLTVTSDSGNSNLTVARLSPNVYDEYYNTKYFIIIKDSDGIEEYSIKKADGSDFISGSSPCYAEISTSTVTLLSTDFPISGYVIDCKDPTIKYNVQAQMPPLPKYTSSEIRASNNTALTVQRLFLCEYDNTKYNLTISDSDGLKEFTVEKAGGDYIFTGSPPCSTSAQTSTVTLLSTDFPLWGFAYDCKDSSILYEVRAQMPSVPSCPTTNQTVTGTFQVQGLTAAVSGNAVTLSWTTVTTANIGVYNIYRSIVSNFTIGLSTLRSQVNDQSYTENNVSAGTYYYKVAAQDVNGTIYTPSSEVKVDVVVSATNATTCPSCPSPTAWSACVNNAQSRTNYQCNTTSNQCQGYTESQSCTTSNVTPPTETPTTPSTPPVQTPSGGGGGGGGGVTIPTCKTQGAAICSISETCLEKWLSASDTDRCCSKLCVPIVFNKTEVEKKTEELSQTRQQSPQAAEISTVLPALELAKKNITNPEHINKIEQVAVETLETVKFVASFENQTKTRGVDYSIRWIFGFVAEQEKRDAQFLEARSEELLTSSNNLKSIAEDLEDVNAKNIILGESEKLKTQANELSQGAKQKRENARGILSWIENFFGRVF